MGCCVKGFLFSVVCCLGFAGSLVGATKVGGGGKLSPDSQRCLRALMSSDTATCEASMPELARKLFEITDSALNDNVVTEERIDEKYRKAILFVGCFLSVFAKQLSADEKISKAVIDKKLIEDTKLLFGTKISKHNILSIFREGLLLLSGRGDAEKLGIDVEELGLSDTATAVYEQHRSLLRKSYKKVVQATERHRAANKK